MSLTTAGINHIAHAIIGDGVTPFNHANARLGVGNGTTAFSVSQTDLQGQDRARTGMDDGYPSIAADASRVSFKSTFGPLEANFAWNEWGVFNTESDGVMLNRVVESNGTKQPGQTWILEVSITFTIGN